MDNNLQSIDIYKLWLALKMPSVTKYQKLLDLFGTAENIYKDLELIHNTNPQLITDANYNLLNKESPVQLIDRLGGRIEKNQIYVLFKDDSLYFTQLKSCSDSPNVLFLRGNMPEYNRLKLGIVGTRRYSHHGADATDDIAYSLARNDVIIVSGMAMGVDTIAAESALRGSNSNCATIAVLGSGVDVPIPAINTKLYERIMEHGLIVSQFEPGAMADKHTFPMRNKVIAGISDSLIVAEAGERSGALITADASHKYGRRIYCVLGKAGDYSFAGSADYVERGLAKEIRDYSDILWDFPKFSGGAVEKSEAKAVETATIPSESQEQTVATSSEGQEQTAVAPSESQEQTTAKKKTKKSCKKIKKSPEVPLDETQQLIYNALIQEPKHFDELLDITGIGIDDLYLRLAIMEANGVIKQMIGKVYQLV